MAKSKESHTALPGWVASRHTYKKLGTIIEHLTDCLNPFFYEIRITCSPQPYTAIIRIFPFANQGVMFPPAVWELVWTNAFNNKIYIEETMLRPGAEW